MVEEEGGEGVYALSKRLRFWMPSWPRRAARPKREKPKMLVSRAIGRCGVRDVVLVVVVSYGIVGTRRRGRW